MTEDTLLLEFADTFFRRGLGRFIMGGAGMLMFGVICFFKWRRSKKPDHDGGDSMARAGARARAKKARRQIESDA